MASGALGDPLTRNAIKASDHAPRSLLDLLSNTLVLYQTIPHLPVSSILSLAATSQSFRHLLHGTPGVFRHLDLTSITSAQLDVGGIDHGDGVWRTVHVDENGTEDAFYARPLRSIFSNLRQRDILDHVNTLVLDRLSVTAEFVNDILVDPALRIRILSIREAKNLNERRLMQTLQYACRPTRPKHLPYLKAIYYFGKADAASLPASPPRPTPPPQARISRAAEISAGWNRKSQRTLRQSIDDEVDDWYGCKGRMVSKPVAHGWAETLLACRAALRFDAVLCTGPRHRNSPAFGSIPVDPPSIEGGSFWSVATFAVGGCVSCGSAPEGFTVYDNSPDKELPLLAPVLLHSSSVKSACHPGSRFMTTGDTDSNQRERHEFVPRCLECIRDRYCFSCNQWWCEACYKIPRREDLATAITTTITTTQHSQQHAHAADGTNDGLVNHEPAASHQSPEVKTPKITRSCWECEHNCLECIAETQKRCQACGGDYCIIHHEGSNLKWGVRCGMDEDAPSFIERNTETSDPRLYE